MSKPKFGRRAAIRAGGIGLTGLVAERYLPGGAFAQPELLQEVAPADRKLLFVVCAMGGASMIDGFMPIAETEISDPSLAQTLNCFPESLIEQSPGSNIRNVGLLGEADYGNFERPPNGMAALLQRHKEDMVVMAHEVSSVNHGVAQQRSLNGAGANGGRTLMEAMALRYGGGAALPNANMAIGGFAQHGSDASVPMRARHETIVVPRMFGAGTHGYRGLPDVPVAGKIDRARRVREGLDRESVFARTFGKTRQLREYLEQRRYAAEVFEGEALIDKLLLLDPATSAGVATGLQSAQAAELYRRFPDLGADDFQAQLGLAFLLAYHGASVSVTLGFRQEANIVGSAVRTTPLAFDFSHSSHRMPQSVMWGQLGSGLDVFISLLKEYDYLGDPALGKMWDRSLIYVATDFGRDKTRPAGALDWSSGHDLNNGSLLISPLLRGNRVYGGVDTKTAFTYGFDPITGEPDPSRTFLEEDVYGLVAHALDIDYAGRREFPCIVRG